MASPRRARPSRGRRDRARPGRRAFTDGRRETGQSKGTVLDRGAYETPACTAIPARRWQIAGVIKGLRITARLLP